MPLKGRRTHATHRYHQPSSTQTVKSSTGTGKNYVQTITTTATPSEEHIVQETGDGSNVNIPNPASVVTEHSHGGVLFGSLLLLLFATWAGFWSPLLNAMWVLPAEGKPQTWHSTIDGRLVLGGVVFCIVLAMLANSSDAMGSIITVLLIGLWVIFLTQNGIALKNGQKVPSGIIVDFFNWFSAHSQNTTSTTATTTGSATNATHPNPKPGSKY